MTAALKLVRPEAESAPATLRCLHCAQPLLDQSVAPFCCRGCRAVYRYLDDAGLQRFYHLRRGPGLPIGDQTVGDHKWLEQLCSQDGSQGDHPVEVELEVQGIHCAGCIWLLQELFRRRMGSAASISLNPALGRVQLRVPDVVGLRAWVSDVEAVGYRLGPCREDLQRSSDALLVKMGICIALAGNTMLFSSAIYLGLQNGPVYDLLNQLSYAAGLLAVLIGGSVFVRSSISSLKRGLLHFDTPIALGVVLAFVSASISFFMQDGRAEYVDTLTVFVALMLTGRWLQERALERNRRLLLADHGVDDLLARRVSEGRPDIVACKDIQRGDVLLVLPGELIPVNIRLHERVSRCSLDWIDGESVPRRFVTGDVIPAGAFNVDVHALRGEVLEDFDNASVARLLRSTSDNDNRAAIDRWWAFLSAFYVLGVVGIASIGIVGWWLATADAMQALKIGTALLIVTCPCAFGIAVPLAREMVHVFLRRRGIFVRREGLLERLPWIRHIAFDKTGTLTTGQPALVDPLDVGTLPLPHRQVLYSLAAASAHPKSNAVSASLVEDSRVRLLDIRIQEHVGYGVEAYVDGRRYRLGAPSWASGSASDPNADLVFSIDGIELCTLRMREAPRPDAESEVRRLLSAGYELSIVSGDTPDRVHSLARSLPIPSELCLGGLTPEDKARYIAAHRPEQSLFVGDGLNDRAAMERAACSGTPAVNRPFMASRCDFYFVSPGLHAVAQILYAAKQLQRTIRRVLVYALVYNACAVGLAMAGLMQPWVAAVIMPLSALATLGYVAVTVSPRRLQCPS